MSSIFSTQNRQTFLRRKYCFFPTATALSPPVGRCEAAIGLPPFCSAMFFSSIATSLPVHPEPRPAAAQAPEPVQPGLEQATEPREPLPEERDGETPVSHEPSSASP